MTTANKLTFLRMVLIPIMVIFWLIPIGDPVFLNLHINEIIATSLFVVATLTDFLDGYVARKYDQITNLGKFLDPLADKVLVITAMTYLIATGRIAFWGVSIIIFREFLVTGIRILAAEKGTVIAASPFGKIKTALTMIAIILMLFNDFTVEIIEKFITNPIWYLAIAFTLVSGVDYLVKNFEVFKE